MNLGKKVRISWKASLDKSINPLGVHIGDFSALAGGVVILAHDASRHLKTNTIIGKNCFIATNAIILPGIKIGDEVVVGAGAVVMKDVPSNCMVAGNPAKIINADYHCGHYGTPVKSI